MMICSVKCSCLLCRELQSYKANTPKNGYKRESKKMSDNFILKKAEAFESSSAMKFIRGAARLSVRHWQNKETYIPPRNSHQSVSKSTSCEQLYPFKKEEERSSFKFRRIPSSELLVNKSNNSETKQLFKMLSNSKLKNKLNNFEAGDNGKIKSKSMLNFMKNDNSRSSKQTHEKYVPIIRISSPINDDHIYSELQPKTRIKVKSYKPPIYQAINKASKGQKSDDTIFSESQDPSKKIFSNRPLCYEELTRKLSEEHNKKIFDPENASKINGVRGSSNKITQNNNKVVIYFGDSIVRNSNCNNIVEVESSHLKKKENIYANRLLEETKNLGVGGKDSADTERIAKTDITGMPLGTEAIYSEIRSKERNELLNNIEDQNNKSIDNTTYKCKKNETALNNLIDGVLNIEFKENYEFARRWVDIISGRVDDVDEATILDSDEETQDWSFIQNWRKRPSNGSRPVYDDNNLSNRISHSSIIPMKPSCQENNAHNPGHHINVNGFQQHSKAKVKASNNIIQIGKQNNKEFLQRQQDRTNSNSRLIPHSHSNLNNNYHQKHDLANGYLHYQSADSEQSFSLNVKGQNSTILLNDESLSRDNLNIQTDEGSSFNNLSDSLGDIRKNAGNMQETGVGRSCHMKSCGPQLKSVTTPSKITVQSTPVKCQNPMNSYGIERNCGKQDVSSNEKEWLAAVAGDGAPGAGEGGDIDSTLIPQHHHIDMAKDVINSLQQGVPGVRECNSSSDENRSSGHASMSDSGGAGGRARAQHHARSRHRIPNDGKLQSPWARGGGAGGGGGGLDDIRSALRQLTLRSHASSSTGTTTSCSDGGATHRSASARRRRTALVRQPSLDTVCTNVTNADEFVWLDSHNRLVELSAVPWSAAELRRALVAGRGREAAARTAPDTHARLSYLLQRALVRVSREAQRLAAALGVCSKHEVASALRIVLAPSLADLSVKACLRAASMFATAGEGGARCSKSARAQLQLSVGRFHRWMVDVRIAPFVHEYAAIYLCAGMEALLEEILVQCAPVEASGTTETSVISVQPISPGQALVGSPSIAGVGMGPALTPAALDRAVGERSDLWGLLQPYAHLNAGRLASGALSMSRWTSLSSLGSGGSGLDGRASSAQAQVGSTDGNDTSTTASGGSRGASTCSAESLLLTTCVGSVAELRDALSRLPHGPPLASSALEALFYYMRCSQLEGGSQSGAGSLQAERAGGVLPPLGAWLRVLGAHAAARRAPAADADDVLQAARLLLPGVDCPPRPLGLEDALSLRRGACAEEEGSRAALAAAHALLRAGRPELLPAARALLPPGAGLDALDHSGLTALMKAATNGDEQTLTMLLEAGASVDVETPGCAPPSAPGLGAPPAPPPPQAQPPYGGATAGWTALVYACARGRLGCASRLLLAGAHAQGAARAEERVTLTPLQVACGGGYPELVRLLLQHGAQPFLSTLPKDALCYSGSAQRGCYSPISVCCAHGRRACLHALLAHAPARGGDVLSLEEILAEGAGAGGGGSAPQPPAAAAAPRFTKTQLRALQEAMYHAAENNHLDITLELRALGVSWSLHAWTLSLAAAADAGAETVIDQLLQDFLQVCPTDDSHYNKAFIYECLPLLFNIFRYSKKESTILMLADIFCTCYGWEPVKPVAEPTPAPPGGPRIDPAYINNPELSDVTFRVEGRLFYGHKIVLVTESARFRALLAPPAASTPALPPHPPPIVQINDIRYHIFEQVMQFLYRGGCGAGVGGGVAPGDVLELLAAAAFFQLLPLQRHCEARAAHALHLHNLVSVYIHAKVYNANELLEYCQGFMLQNLVALLTYDAAAKRLLFGKRLPGHSVPGALLHTLQRRIEARKATAKPR